MNQYLAIVANNTSNNNITFEAENFKDASNILKERIKKGVFFDEIKLLELDTMKSRKYYIGNK